MPNRHFLTKPEPLTRQVARFLGEAAGAGRLKIEDTLLITPTAGAARSVVQALVAKGFKAPKSCQPMQALLTEKLTTASPIEQSLAWSEALESLSERERSALFWKREPRTLAERIKAGSNFAKLANLLAEAGLSPSTVQLQNILEGGFDEGRWSAISSLHRNYLDKLKAWRLHDPNEVRITESRSPSQRIGHVVIAGVPDVPRIVETYCTQLEASGCRIDLLIWNPTQSDESSYDLFGRPIPELWNKRTIEFSDRQLNVAASAHDEARLVVDQLLDVCSAGLVVVDPKLQSLLAAEILSKQQKPYLPEGESLIRSEAAKLVLSWDEFQIGQDLRHLRRLTELPAFCRALDNKDPISQTDALTAIDHLLGESIASTLESGWSASPPLPEEAQVRDRTTRAIVRRLLGAVRAKLHCSGFELLEFAFPEDERPESVQRLLQLGKELSDSPALKGRKGIPIQILIRAMLSEQIQSPAPPESITINGWLEAPWLGQQRLMLSGLIEGQLPQSIDGDPFLPDSIRPALGLNSNEQRLARDAYLLGSLVASRNADCVQLSFSKYNSEGDPNRPSRLLLRTERKQLATRVKQVIQANTIERPQPRRQTGWKWKLPGSLPPLEKISPTHFEGYLACPLRFCLEKVLKLGKGPEASREMNAAVFGSLIHQALENFARSVIPAKEQMLKMSEQEIRQQVQQLLASEALKLLGPDPAPAVRIQLANAAARLNAFARVQSACFAEGWIITDAERKLDADAENALQIGSLRLSGIIDRVDQHAETGALRIMDYKTFSSLSKPADKHLGPLSHNWLPEAQIKLPSGKTKTWKNLQLPLYRKILEHWYPGETAGQPPETAYFVLPSDPNESGIYSFDELNEESVYESALNCAESVASHIHDGVFWPPQTFKGSWDDPLAPLLVNGPLQESIHPETIELLKGGRNHKPEDIIG
ncbi:MAG: PD-(D/E)XK nuclease family protein [Verrucomicrobiota bacterium]